MAEKVKIGKMRVEPVFTVAAWMDIEERFGSLGEAIDAMKENGKWIEATAAMTAILCNHGLRKMGKKSLLTQENVIELMRPVQMVKARNLCLAAIAEGSKTETEEEDDEEPVDVVLEELQKKTDATSAPRDA